MWLGWPKIKKKASSLITFCLVYIFDNFLPIIAFLTTVFAGISYLTYPVVDVWSEYISYELEREFYLHFLSFIVLERLSCETNTETATHTSAATNPNEEAITAIRSYLKNHSTESFLKEPGKHWYDLTLYLSTLLTEEETKSLLRLCVKWRPRFGEPYGVQEKAVINQLMKIFFKSDLLDRSELLDLIRKLEADALYDPIDSPFSAGCMVFPRGVDTGVFSPNLECLRRVRKYLELSSKVLFEEVPKLQKIYLLNFYVQNYDSLRSDPELGPLIDKYYVDSQLGGGLKYPTVLNRAHALYLQNYNGSLRQAKLQVAETPYESKIKNMLLLFFYCNYQLEKRAQPENILFFYCNICDPFRVELYKITFLYDLSIRAVKEGIYETRYLKLYAPLENALVDNLTFPDEEAFYKILHERAKKFIMKQYTDSLIAELRSRLPGSYDEKFVPITDELDVRAKILLILAELDLFENKTISARLRDINKYEWVQAHGFLSREANFYIFNTVVDDSVYHLLQQRYAITDETLALLKKDVEALKSFLVDVYYNTLEKKLTAFLEI